MAISFDKLLNNFKTFSLEDIQQEVLALFEPIIYQVVLTTRYDTGTARASIAYPFVKDLYNSERILQAIDSDVEAGRPAYHYWENYGFKPRSPYKDYKGTANALFTKKKIKVEVIAYDDGLVNQENGETGSIIHPRNDYAPNSRFKPYHITKITQVIDSLDLDNITGDGYYVQGIIANNIRDRLNDVYKAIERRLFE